MSHRSPRKSAKEHLERARKLLKESSLAKIRRLVQEGPSSLRDQSEEEVIRRLRVTRQELWEAKLASHSR